MISFFGYRITDTLGETLHSHVYRAVRLSDNLPVILKAFRTRSHPLDLAKPRQEFELQSRLDTASVATAYAFEQHEGVDVLVIEDFGGVSLDRCAADGALDIATCLQLATHISHGLHQLHQRRIIHCDINPSNIVWNRKTGVIKIIDLGLASERWEDKTDKAGRTTADRVEGTLIYMSPEQTGRLHQALDYRTDFYSFGITLYKLLSGQLPFAKGDAAETTHAHIAKQPQALETFLPSVPGMVSAIIRKLMAKTPDQRYQSALGIQADLQRCIDTLDAQGNIAPFALGSHDFSERLTLPTKLYGRADAARALADSFDKVRDGESQLLLICGPAGAGKSALVAGLETSLSGNGSIFVKGKIDQFKQNMPYASLMQAFKELVHKLLIQDEHTLLHWKARLQDALGDAGKIITDVIADVELIIGVQPDIPELPADQTRLRFHAAFRNFIGVFASAASPLVLFLDDLHWADMPSVQLIGALMQTPPVPHVLILGSYRDDELDDRHPLSWLRQHMARYAQPPHIVTLSLLSENDITALLADALHVAPEEARELARLCLAKTLGNPFFLNQFLGDLASKALLVADPAHGCWRWDLARIEQTAFVENVIDLMLVKFRQLPPSTQYALQSAASLGGTFDLDTLATITHLSASMTFDLLWTAIDEGLLLGVSEPAVLHDIAARTPETRPHPGSRFRFLHDRVQQAAYLLRTPQEQQETHLAIARLWLRTWSEVQQQEMLFELVNHFNLAIGLIDSVAERVRVATLNLTAAKRARAQAAYKPTLIYAQAAMRLLDQDGWRVAHDLMLETYLVASEAAYLCGNIEGVASYTATYIDHVDSIMATTKAVEIQILADLSQGKFKEAVMRGLTLLSRFGVNFPPNPHRIGLIVHRYQTAWRMSGKRIPELALMPAMQDPEKLAISNILGLIISAAYRSLPQYRAHLPSASVLLARKYGNATTTDYVSYGVLLASSYGNINKGKQVGELALQLQQRQPIGPETIRVQFLTSYFIQPWHKSIRDIVEPLSENYRLGVAIGRIEWANISLHGALEFALFGGRRITELEALCTAKDALIRSLWPSGYLTYSALLQTLHNLLGRASNPADLLGEHFTQERRALFEKDDTNNAMQICVISKQLFLAYLFHDDHNAARLADIADRYQSLIPGFYTSALACFYGALIRLKSWATASRSTRRDILRAVRIRQKQLRIWAQEAPANFSHKWHLIEAERLRCTGHAQQAASHYDYAIRLAKQHQFIHEEALAQELAGAFYATAGKDLFAKAYLKEAHRNYQRWGAVAKAQHLAQCYPLWLRHDAPPATVRELGDRSMSDTIITGASQVDVASAMKASQVLSQEIRLDRLLKRLMTIVIENAGAQKGILLLKKDQQWRIEAEQNDGDSEATVLESIPLARLGDDEIKLPLSLVHLVSRTRESVVIQDAISQPLFEADPYVQRHQVHSALCIPVMNHNEMTGMLYLENNAIAGAFTPTHLEMLNVLASQVAISIENARLYAEMEERVAARTAELKALTLQDGLTGIANRRAFEERLQLELGRTQRSGQPLAVLMIDIDHFKLVNDRYGHPVGDHCLTLMGRTLSHCCQRTGDFVARYGGEEFVCILADTDLQGATVFAERVLTAVRAIVLEVGADRHPITSSVGIAITAPYAPMAASDLIACADRRLYGAKLAGRDCIVNHD